MSERTPPDLSELAYHIVSLHDYWHRSSRQHRGSITAIKPMVEIYFGSEDADSIARSVVAVLEYDQNIISLEPDCAQESKIDSVTSLLQKQSVDLSATRATKHWDAIFSSRNCVDSLCA